MTTDDRLEQISFRLLTLNLAFWLLVGMAIMRACQ